MGNLSPMVGEELLITLFSQIGPCINCKIIHEVSGLGRLTAYEPKPEIPFEFEAG